MAGFDPSVISSIGDSQYNPAAAKGKALTLAGEMDKQQLGNLQLREAQQDYKERQIASDVLKNAKYDSPESVAKTAEELNRRGAGKYAMQFMKQAQDYQTGAIEQQRAALALADERIGSIGAALFPITQQLEEAKATGKVTPVALNAMARDLMGPAIQNLEAARPDLKPYIDQFKQNPQLQTYEGLIWLSRSTSKTLAMIRDMRAEHAQQTKDRQEQDRENRTAAQIENYNSLEKRRLQLEEDAKLPTNYRWADKERTKMEPIPGGPADPKSPNYKPPSSGGATGREMIFFKRVQGAGNELTSSLANIMELPMGVSSGLLGYGGSPGESLFKSAGNAFKNKMTSQDVQSYMSMLPGVAKSLASIDAQGMQSPQGLQNLMDKLSLKEGDTYMTKLRKMADMRQIAEKGLEIWASNPRIPQEEKDKTADILEQIRSAVPFTQHDITAYQRSLKKNPDMTLMEFAQSKGLGTAGKATKTPDLPPGFTLDK